MAKDRLIKTANIQTTAREVDFVSRFQLNWQHLRDILGIMRLIRKTPGTTLKSKYAEITLQSGEIGEGEDIPYSEATVLTKDYATINVEKFAKGVSIEAINEHGYNDAVQLTDRQFMFELTTNITGRFYTHLNSGTLISAKGTFQAALAEAQGRVRNKWKAMHRGITQIVGFCNILDAYDYLGTADISTQTQFGMTYIENFLGYNKLFLCAEGEVPRGKILATPVENLILYYVAPGDSDFTRAGLVYTTQGETSLIGYHVEGNYHNAVSESFALMGMTLMAEYIDGVASVDIGTATFSAVASPTKANLGSYFEKDANNEYFVTTDTDVVASKTYYTRSVTRGA